MRNFLAFLCALIQGLACSYQYTPSCETGSKYDQVFVGTVTEERTGLGTFLFRIDEPLKGIRPGLKEIEVGQGPCGDGYKAGERYLILVKPFEGIPGGITSGEPVEYASESIEFFRALARGEHLNIIRGRTLRTPPMIWCGLKWMWNIGLD